ncbi:hypothetical protein MASR2M15_26940 [Anaerolineales bacterium]
MSQKSARQSRKVAEFNDRIAFISIRKLDSVLIVALIAFIVAVIIQNLIRYPSIVPYLIFKDLHFHLSRYSLLMASLMFVLSLYIGLYKHADVTPYFRRGTYLGVGTMLLEALIGLSLFIIFGTRPGDDVHLIYGAATVLALPFFIFVEVTAQKRPAMGSYMWGFGILAAIIIRCMSTGPLT